MRKAIGVLSVFLVGMALGAVLLHYIGSGHASLSLARRNALAILDQPPNSPSTINSSPFTAAIKRIEPAVVNIDTIGKLSIRDSNGVPFFLNQEIHGKGSGVVISPDGYIVTNNHVIEGASRIRVTLQNGKWYYAKLIGTDPSADIAVLRIPASGLNAAQIGNSNDLQVGDWTIAVGNPLGLGSTVTVGIVSALNRHDLQLDEGRSLHDAIQTDAPINRGNSGGALANIAGQLIGINTAILSSGPDGGSIGLGFAIPSNTVRRIARQLILTGKVPTPPQPPWIGVEFSAVPANMAQALMLTSSDPGVLIVRVMPESPASIAGIEDGDILLKIDGQPIKSLNEVALNVKSHKDGDKLTLQIFRPGENLNKSYVITLLPRPNIIPQE